MMPPQNFALWKSTAALQAAVYQDFECKFPLTTVYNVLLAQFFIYAVFSVYLDNVLADKNGMLCAADNFPSITFWGFVCYGLVQRWSRL